MEKIDVGNELDTKKQAMETMYLAEKKEFFDESYNKLFQDIYTHCIAKKSSDDLLVKWSHLSNFAIISTWITLKHIEDIINITSECNDRSSTSILYIFDINLTHKSDTNSLSESVSDLLNKALYYSSFKENDLSIKNLINLVPNNLLDSATILYSLFKGMRYCHQNIQSIIALVLPAIGQYEYERNLLNRPIDLDSIKLTILGKSLL